MNSKIQKAAQDALSGYTGACVVMDPETGAVLGMASSPTYDAADFAAEIGRPTPTDGESTLLNRAIQTLYAPGSTFKIVTLATALEDDVASEATVFSSPGTMDIGNAPVTNFNELATATSRSPAPPNCPATPCSASWARKWARRSSWTAPTSSASTARSTSR